MFPAAKKQFSIKYKTTVFSELQLNPIKPLTFATQEAFPLAFTLIKVLLPNCKTKSTSGRTMSRCFI